MTKSAVGTPIRDLYEDLSRICSVDYNRPECGYEKDGGDCDVFNKYGICQHWIPVGIGQGDISYKFALKGAKNNCSYFSGTKVSYKDSVIDDIIMLNCYVTSMWSPNFGNKEEKTLTLKLEITSATPLFFKLFSMIYSPATCHLYGLSGEMFHAVKDTSLREGTVLFTKYIRGGCLELVDENITKPIDKYFSRESGRKFTHVPASVYIQPMLWYQPDPLKGKISFNVCRIRANQSVKKRLLNFDNGIEEADISPVKDSDQEDDSSESEEITPPPVTNKKGKFSEKNRNLQFFVGDSGEDEQYSPQPTSSKKKVAVAPSSSKKKGAPQKKVVVVSSEEETEEEEEEEGSTEEEEEVVVVQPPVKKKGTPSKKQVVVVSEESEEEEVVVVAPTKKKVAPTKKKTTRS